MPPSRGSPGKWVGRGAPFPQMCRPQHASLCLRWQHLHHHELGMGSFILPPGLWNPPLCILQSFCSSCSLRGHLAGINAPHLFSLPQASISQLRCPNQELSVTHWFCFDFLVYFLESQSQASCLPSVRELLRNDQETWLERCPGLRF